jgi:hypothetical protein
MPQDLDRGRGQGHAMLPPQFHTGPGDGPQLRAQVDLAPAGAERSRYTGCGQDGELKTARHDVVTLAQRGHEAGHVSVG